MYQHQTVTGEPISLPVGKVVCIGQNYQDHIAEMQSKTAEEALFFIKPATALCRMAPFFAIPADRGSVHNETEIAVLLAKPLSRVNPAEVLDAVWGYSLALDLTLRDVQARQKQLGRPWEVAKAFDGACPVAGFIPAQQLPHPQQLDFSLHINGQLRQQGNSANMIRGIAQTISEMSQHFTLLPGDIILTGTPAGVGPLQSGDQLKLQLAGLLQTETQVA